MQEEIWKDIPNYEGLYQVSNLGKVKSLPRKTCNQYQKGILMKPIKTRFGYLKVELYKNTKAKWFPIHRLVAMTFLNEFDNNLQVNHKNGIKTDNTIDNLEMVTASENQFHSYRVLKNVPPMQNHFGKDHVRAIKINQYDKNNSFIKTWDSIIEASNEIGVPACCITNCAKGRRKSAGNFIWKYVN